MLVAFEAVAVALWLTLGQFAFICLISVISTACPFSLGVFLFVKECRRCGGIVPGAGGGCTCWVSGTDLRGKHADRGFWYYLFTGVFEAATIHYAVARFSGSCCSAGAGAGYACWTAMVMDFCHLKFRRLFRLAGISAQMRYVMFAVSLFLCDAVSGSCGKYQKNHVLVIHYRKSSVLCAGGSCWPLSIKTIGRLQISLSDHGVFLKPMSYFALIRAKMR